MVYNVYSIRDTKTSFASPFVDVCDESAIRGFEFAFRSNSGVLTFSPADFCLYRIGKFDSTSGHLTDELPAYLCSAADFRKDGFDET